MRKYTFIIPAFIVLLYGCSTNNKKEDELRNEIDKKNRTIENLNGEIKQVINERDTLTKNYIKLTEENNALTEDIAKGMEMINQIQKNLDFITTLEKPLIYPADIEKKTKQSEIFSNIRLIEQYIKNTDNLIRQLRDSTSMIPHFEEYIIDLTKKIEEKNLEVQNIKSQVQNLQKDLSEAEKKIANQEIEIEELNRKTIIFVSNKQTVLIDAQENLITIPFKFTIKDILTNHPSSSYSLTEIKGKEMHLQIHNLNNFWNEGNYMIIKVNRKDLKSL